MSLTLMTVPTYLTSAGDAATLMRKLRDGGIDACVGGGWGVDALLGEQTRVHSDLDLWLAAPALEGLSRGSEWSDCADRPSPYDSNSW